MALVPGTRLGPYEVVGPLGAGGMGEVYRAKDTKLGREVALKRLPEHLAQDPERLARFEREARTLAALNHPHIAQVYGLEDAPSPTGSGAGLRALVMELVEGPTLAERIASLRGPGVSGPPTGLPLDEALPIAQQIAEALEAAHDQGIVHRDLKPANIKVRPDGTVKVLDFGLAKAVAGESGVRASDTLANSPTITSPAMTMQGVILGTAAYMSPEQAKGKPVDRRADIWAFGCVLFEMLTGRRAFEGEDVSDTLAAVLRGEPPWAALPSGTPPHVRTMLARCIERDVRKRLPHIGVARLELTEGAARQSVSAAAASPAPRASWRVHAMWAAAVMAAVAGAVYASRNTGVPLAPVPPSVRFELAPPPGHIFPGAGGVPRFAVSPDGTRVVFAATRVGVRDQLFVRRLDDVAAVPIDGTESQVSGGDAIQQPFFSPDGRYVAFFSGAESMLKRVPVDGGPVERLASFPAQNCGGTWHGDVILIASQGSNGVLRVPAGGGEPQHVTSLDVSAGELAHLWPQFLPDGQHFLYFARSAVDSRVRVGTLDGAPPRTLVPAEAMAGFAAPDQVLYVRDGTLVAQRLDLKAMALVGSPTTVAPNVMVASNTRVGMSSSASGALVFAAGNATAGNYNAVIVDRKGKRLGEPVEAGLNEAWVRLSRDEQFVAFHRGAGTLDVWVHHLSRRITSRVSSAAAGSDRLPVWAPDSRRLAYQSNRDAGRAALYVRDLDALHPETRLQLNGDGRQVMPDDWSPDGKYLLFRDVANDASDLMSLPLPTGEPVVYLRDGFRNRHAAFSPDGRWVAYSSNESGALPQVFVRSFPDPAQAKFQVSADGGAQPRWRRDGRELYFVSGRAELVAAAVTPTEGGLRFGTATPLFGLGTVRESAASVTGLGSTYDVFPDGQRFVLAEPVSAQSDVKLTVALNWMNDLKK